MKIRIQREARAGYSARVMQISIDGTISGTLQNGEDKTFEIQNGKHGISFQLSKKTLAFASISENSDDEVLIVCWFNADGSIEVHSANQCVNVQESPNKRSYNSTAWVVVLCAAVAAVVVFLLKRANIVVFFFSSV